MADRRLAEVRTEFIEGINKPVISQLLDDLLSKKVLNEEEVDEVKENAKKQDQARLLIDHVRRKGPEASCLLIVFLHARDSFLAERLGLQNFLPVCPPIECNISEGEVQSLESRNGIRLCPLNLFQKIQANESTEIYPIKDPRTRMRLALIICNIKFDHLPERKGAEVDQEQMKLLLEDLGYSVEVKTNLSSQGITTCLAKFAARKEHEASDGMFVVLMSHGLQDSICGVHAEGRQSDIFSINTIFSVFNNKNCPALRGKPKVVIIQACRGEKLGYMYVEDADTSVPACPDSVSWPYLQLQTDAIQKVHVESDFICLYSTTLDHVSWRSPISGSVFINQLIENIKKHAWNCGLEEVFRKSLDCNSKQTNLARTSLPGSPAVKPYEAGKLKKQESCVAALCKQPMSDALKGQNHPD